MSLSLAHH